MNYTIDNFEKTSIVSSDVVGYIIGNVRDFDLRYELAMREMDRLRCDLVYADRGLWEDICEAAQTFICDRDGIDDYDYGCDLVVDVETDLYDIFG